IMYIVEKTRYRLEALHESDMLNNYFEHAPLYLSVLADEKNCRVENVANDDKHPIDEDEKKNKMDESLTTWHSENKDNENENFLRFELE
ncbi:VWA domain-containing protein, partial [Bacillus cereus]|nr:VWA domain-containing protein [Bacillus cereus]